MGPGTKEVGLPESGQVPVASTEGRAAVYADDIDRLLKDYLEVRKQTSDLVRYIGFGLIAYFISVTNSSPGLAYRIGTDSPKLLLSVALCGSLVVALDYLNLVSRASAQSRLLDLIDSDDPKVRRSADQKHYLYDPNDIYYRFSYYCFCAKQILAIGGCAFLIAGFVAALLG